MILVSACLAGVNCKYDGGHNLVHAVRDLVAQGLALPVCPEQLGGCPTPREPVELTKVSGEDVLDGKGRVTTVDGVDLTEAFLKGACEVLKIAQMVNADSAILKQRSPSCGTDQVYDGSFTGTVCPGRGITAALLVKHGLKLYSEDEVDILITGRSLL